LPLHHEGVSTASRQANTRVGTDWRSVADAYADEEERRHWTSLAEAGLLPFEQRLVVQWIGTKGRVLVVGCGAGRESLALGRQGFEAVGLDISLPLIRDAASRASSHRVHHLAADTARLPFRDGTFDGILVFSQALAHVPGRERRRDALRDMIRALRAGGTILMALNHRTLEDYSIAYLLHRFLVRTGGRSGSRPGRSGRAPPRGPQRSGLPGRVAAMLVLMTRARVLRWRIRIRVLRYRLFGPPPSGPESPRDLHVHIRRSRASFRPRPGLTYFHLYVRDEFLEDVAATQLQVAAVYSWRELNGDQLPSVLQRVDFKFLYVLRKARTATPHASTERPPGSAWSNSDNAPPS